MNKREIAEKLVEEYLTLQGKRNFQVLHVWHAYVLGNDKWLFTATAGCPYYFEVTRNNSKGEYYLDVYKKKLNQVWKECLLHDTKTCYKVEENDYEFREYMGVDR